MTCPNYFSLHLLAAARRGSCWPTWKLILLYAQLNGVVLQAGDVEEFPLALVTHTHTHLHTHTHTLTDTQTHTHTHTQTHAHTHTRTHTIFDKKRKEKVRNKVTELYYCCICRLHNGPLILFGLLSYSVQYCTNPIIALQCFEFSTIEHMVFTYLLCTQLAIQLQFLM